MQRSILVIGQSLYDNCHTGWTVTLESQFLIGLPFQLAGTLLNGPVDIIIRHADCLCLINRNSERGVKIRIPPSFAATIICLVYFVNIAALRASCADFLPAIVPCLPNGGPPIFLYFSCYYTHSRFEYNTRDFSDRIKTKLIVFFLFRHVLERRRHHHLDCLSYYSTPVLLC